MKELKDVIKGYFNTENDMLIYSQDKNRTEKKCKIQDSVMKYKDENLIAIEYNTNLILTKPDMKQGDVYLM